MVGAGAVGAGLVDVAGLAGGGAGVDRIAGVVAAAELPAGRPEAGTLAVGTLAVGAMPDPAVAVV